MVDHLKTDDAAAREALCPHCRGSGTVSYGCGAIPCAACGGTGIVPKQGDPGGSTEKARDEDPKTP